MDQIFAEMIGTASIAIALLGIVLCLTQAAYPRVKLSFALFLAAVAITNIPDAFLRIIAAIETAYIQPIELMIWLPSALSLAPLFWIYVCTLTSRSQRRPAHLYRHLLLPGLAALSCLILIFSPQNVWAEIFSQDAFPEPRIPSAIAIIIVLLQIALYPQLAIYLIWTVRRMMRYRLMLRDFYASTEQHELRWIYVIGGLGFLYWLAQALILFTAFDVEQAGIPPIVLYPAGFVSLAIVAVITLWGVRQRPLLVPPDAEYKQLHEDAENLPSQQTVEKYEKSALNVEASERIARKLRAAMEQDHLHRNPNLSLWVLARHIGASSNYISQTLNEEIGENFFDFVNGYRIADAKDRLSTTDDSVLAITYDVGFNARSSFYNAFKRVTGQTPTSFRKNMSHPVELDDFQA